MGIEVVLKVRHHDGFVDLFCPRIRCDACDELIEDGTGNVWWSYMDEARAVAGVAPLFAHKLCRDGRHPAPGWPPGEAPGVWTHYEKVTGQGMWLSEELAVFCRRLARNASLTRTAARA